MSDLTARAITDLRAELAESKAAANRVTESMGSEIMRLTAELEQQRTRAEAAEQELREQHAAYIAPMSDKLAAIRAHLAGVDVAKLAKLADERSELIQRERAALLCEHFGDAAIARSDIAIIDEAIRDAAPVLLAAAREALEP